MRRALFTLVIFLTLSIVGCDDQGTLTSPESQSPQTQTSETSESSGVTSNQKGLSSKPEALTDSSFTANSASVSPQSHSSNYGTSIYGPVQGSVSNGGRQQLLYKSPSYYSSGYIYTAVLRTTSGNADLHQYQKVNGSFRKLEESEKSGTTKDVVRFTKSAFLNNPSRIDLDAIGRQYSNYEFELYRKSTNLEIHWGFPLSRATGNYTPGGTPVTGLLDLDTSSDRIELRDGQYGRKSDGCLAYNGGGGNEKRCYKVSNPDLKAFETHDGTDWNTSWVDYRDKLPNRPDGKWLWYDDHTGYDYDVPEYRNATAAAPGKVTDKSPGLGQVEITHRDQGDYRTYYTHMRNIQVSVGEKVYEGQLLGDVSDKGTGGVHLHFTVRQNVGGNWVLLDPYGEPGLYPYMWE